MRLFSEYDPLYPLLDDLGSDGITLYSTGPPRSLRHITRAIIQQWEGWEQFRDNWISTTENPGASLANSSTITGRVYFEPVGVQHLLLPDPFRYFNDRFVSVNVGVPPIDSVVRISSEELFPALNSTFPLDTFHISYIPQAIRR